MSDVIKNTYRPKDGRVGEQARTPTSWLPPGYMLDESDPSFVILRRSDGTFVAAFSALGTTEDGIRQTAKDDLLGEVGT